MVMDRGERDRARTEYVNPLLDAIDAYGWSGLGLEEGKAKGLWERQYYRSGVCV